MKPDESVKQTGWKSRSNEPSPSEGKKDEKQKEVLMFRSSYRPTYEEAKKFAGDGENAYRTVPVMREIL